MENETPTVQKNRGEIIKLRAQNYLGTDVLNVRVCSVKRSGAQVPTRKGLTLRPEVWAELLPVIASELERMGAEADGVETGA